MGCFISQGCCFARHMFPALQLHKNLHREELIGLKQNKGRIAVIIVCMLLAFGISAGTMGKMCIRDRAQIPTSSLNGFYTDVVDPFLFRSGTLTVPYEQLDYFNELVQGTISVFQYGGF